MTAIKKYISHISIVVAMLAFSSCQALFCTFGIEDSCVLMIESVIVSPESAVINVGDTKQFTAKGIQSDGSIVDISGHVSWSSSDSNIVSISSSNGLGEGVSAGNATLTASVQVQGGYKEAKVNVTVNVGDPLQEDLDGIVDLYIEPDYVETTTDENIQYYVYAVYEDYSEVDVTNKVEWRFDDPSLGVILQDGFFASLKEGTLTIEASYGGWWNTSTIVIESDEVECTLDFSDEYNLNYGCHSVIDDIDVSLGGLMTYKDLVGYGGDDGYVYNEMWNNDDYIYFGTPVTLKSFYMTVKPNSQYNDNDISEPYEIMVYAYNESDEEVWSEMVDLDGTEDWSWVEVDVDTEDVSYLKFIAPGHNIWPSVDNITLST